MKITRRQLKQIIQEELSRLSEVDQDDDVDVDSDDVDSDEVDDAITHFRQSSGGIWPSNMSEVNLRMAQSLLQQMGPGGRKRILKFFEDLISFGPDYLRGNLLALGHYAAHNRYDEPSAAKYFGELKRDSKFSQEPREITEIDGLQNIVGLLSTLERLGEVTKEGDT